MNIHRLPLKILFKEDFVYEYTINRQILNAELLRANTVLFLLDRISKTPLETFFPFGSIFWTQVTDSLFDTCTMCMWRISIDNSNSEGLTLKQFKNRIILNFKDDQYRDVFTEELREVKFEDNVIEIEKFIENIRHNFIAHLNKREYPIFSYKNILWDIKSVSALLNYQNELNRFYDILQFEEKHSLHYAEYSEEFLKNRNEFKPDVDEFLESIIRGSKILNDHAYWEYVKEKILDEKQIATVIDYRNKYDLNDS